MEPFEELHGHLRIKFSSSFRNFGESLSNGERGHCAGEKVGIPFSLGGSRYQRRKLPE
jgi:hypothetical protein